MTEVTTQQEQSKEVTSNANQPAENPGTQPSGIQISDLQTILNIIDLASSRGAFKAAELTAVGGIADKLNAFLSEIAAQAKAQEEQKPAEAKAEATPEASTDAPAEASK
tara:strand:- start:504 stop:830 length:327 start_codon:yes stop_codon:yes gene_type:complete